jgi:hypothetical protein
MLKTIVLILMFFFQIANAAIPGTSNSVASGFSASTNTVANNPFTVPISQLSSMVQICGVTNGTLSRYFGFYSEAAPNYMGQYQVPSGKSFYALVVDAVMAAANNQLYFGYGTSPLGQDDDATAPFGNVPYSESGNPAFMVGPTAVQSSKSGVGLIFPAGSYPYLYTSGTNTTSGDLCIIGIVQ